MKIMFLSNITCSSEYSISVHRNIIFQKFRSLVKWINNNREQIRNILLPIAGLKSIEHEIDGALTSLAGVQEEIAYSNPPLITEIAVFHSSNAILYEYIIHCVIPTLYSLKVTMRPSQKAKQETILIHKAIMKQVDLTIDCCPVSQKEFCAKVRNVDVIVFAGNYNNAVEVMRLCNPTLFLFAGSGSNPFFINRNQDKEKIANVMVENRMLNSGQDCICPNVFFIPTQEKEEWIEIIVKQLLDLNVRKFRVAELTKITSADVLEKNGIIFSRVKKNIRFGGNIDYNSSIIFPTIIYRENFDSLLLQEWFAPVFFLVGYQYEREVIEWLLRPLALKRAMYLSVYGFNKIDERVTQKYVVLYQKSVLEEEHPNKQFGGYGVEASFVKHIQDKIEPKPYLISEEIAYYFKESKCKLRN